MSECRGAGRIRRGCMDVLRGPRMRVVPGSGTRALVQLSALVIRGAKLDRLRPCYLLLSTY
jgi:hypothetical protein